jgi:hypothetical protein
MARDTYERGFLAGLEFGRIQALTCYDAIDAEAMRFKRFLDDEFQKVIAEGEADPDALRRRLLQAWNDRPLPSAEIVSLADVRATMKGAA